MASRERQSGGQWWGQSQADFLTTTLPLCAAPRATPGPAGRPSLEPATYGCCAGGTTGSRTHGGGRCAAGGIHCSQWRTWPRSPPRMVLKTETKARKHKTDFWWEAKDNKTIPSKDETKCNIGPRLSVFRVGTPERCSQTNECETSADFWGRKWSFVNWYPAHILLRTCMTLTESKNSPGRVF